MTNYCSECTYLDLNTGDIYGKFYCEKRWERHLANEIACNRFCKSYNRSESVMKSAYNYSIEKSQSSGCYLTTMLCKVLEFPDNNRYLNTMREFRNNYLNKNEIYRELLVEYDVIGPKIADALYNDPLKKYIAGNFFYEYIISITNSINSKDYDKAVLLYKEMTNKLKKIYNINNSISKTEIDNCDISVAGHGVYKLKKELSNE